MCPPHCPQRGQRGGQLEGGRSVFVDRRGGRFRMHGLGLLLDDGAFRHRLAVAAATGGERKNTDREYRRCDAGEQGPGHGEYPSIRHC